MTFTFTLFSLQDMPLLFMQASPAEFSTKKYRKTQPIIICIPTVNWQAANLHGHKNNSFDNNINRFSRIIHSPIPQQGLAVSGLVTRVPSGCSPLGTDWQLLRSIIPPPQDGCFLQVSLVQTGSSQQRKKEKKSRRWVGPPSVKKRDEKNPSHQSHELSLLRHLLPSPTSSSLPPAGSIHQADRSHLPLVWYLPVWRTKWERWQQRRDVFGFFFPAVAASLRDTTRWTSVWDPGEDMLPRTSKWSGFGEELLTMWVFFPLLGHWSHNQFCAACSAGCTSLLPIMHLKQRHRQSSSGSPLKDSTAAVVQLNSARLSEGCGLNVA